MSAFVAGLDEAGRGPLAGPVYAAAVLLDPNRPIDGLRDSKKLAESRRHALREAIMATALGFAVASASVEEIDHLNILQASLLAMRRAAQLLEDRLGSKALGLVYWVDGNQDPKLDRPTRCLIGGDDLVPAIAAASILAKTSRDAWMIDAAARYPGYDFERHKGYPTAKHRQAIALLGPCAIHRRSFSWK
jgi:ribonuclease HII